jgi:hypothetical protein
VWETGADAGWHTLVFDDKFFLGLKEIDEEIARRVAAVGCGWCGGPLHRSDYDRKPRGGLLAEAGSTCVRRISLCCGREGCRHRATPPSVRFLGRRFYLGAVVVVASALALTLRRASAVWAATEIPARTVKRWARWWRVELPTTSFFIVLQGLLVPPVARATLPCSLLERLGGGASEQLTAALRLLAPLTTGSVVDGARFLRAI